MEEEANVKDKGSAPGQKQDLAGMVSYQTGAIVSRTIINRKTGTITLFPFDEGNGLSEHTNPYDALLYLLEGKAIVTVAGEANSMEEGDGIILPAERPHSVEAVTRFKMLLTMIRS